MTRHRAVLSFSRTLTDVDGVAQLALSVHHVWGAWATYLSPGAEMPR